MAPKRGKAKTKKRKRQEEEADENPQVETPVDCTAGVGESEDEDSDDAPLSEVSKQSSKSFQKPIYRARNSLFGDLFFFSLLP